MKRVLMVSEKFPPFNVSGSARPLYFAKYLPEFGYEPTVLASSVAAGEERDVSFLRALQAIDGARLTVDPAQSAVDEHAVGGCVGRDRQGCGSSD